jgi:hypothetical protein
MLIPEIESYQRLSSSRRDVRFWHLADIIADTSHFRFMAPSGHWGSLERQACDQTDLALANKCDRLFPC